MSFLRDLFGLGDSGKAHQEIYGGYEYENTRQEPRHHSSWTHELVAGAAGFAGMKAYEDHVRRTGQHVSHPLMKEMLAAFAAAEVDKLFETKGLDFLDREQAKRRAVHQAHFLADQQYGQGGTFNYQSNAPPNYSQQQGGQNFYPQQGYYQQQGGQNYYPQQGGPNYYQ